ncbi:MAG: nitrophenyl compound nitroreductase subunit ArsF family protein [Emticicia sp.]|nr:nitrophenyl compound nitroreductase subunit ArsF family protein [Emticicia sp.]
MKSSVVKLLFVFSILFFAKNNTQAQSATLEVIQFHSEHRCVTCLEIEKLTKEVLKTNQNIPFKLVNLDDKKNEKIAESFEATGTALFLYDTKTGKKKDLTSFAFMNAMGEKAKFKSGLTKEIKAFK